MHSRDTAVLIDLLCHALLQLVSVDLHTLVLVTLFMVSKDEWDTKEDTSKSSRCTYCGMPKGTSQAKATLNNKKIKHIALAIVELHRSEGISQ